ncbi:unnamed protein product [Linum trigynum]|uniref:Protein-serine/threonine phosphatase n=1 Tax=Linum trigynum TaxID=586398 RepID=A0AAV2GCF7_9ROSI
MAAKSCRGLPAELAVKLVVKEASRSRGLKDDTTCLVVDIIPSDRPILPTTPRKKNNMLTSLFIEGNLPVLLTRQQISFRLSVSLKSCSKRVPPCLQRGLEEDAIGEAVALVQIGSRRQAIGVGVLKEAVKAKLGLAMDL